MKDDFLGRTTWLEARAKDISKFFSSSLAARLHAADVRTHTAISNAPCILGVFLTVFAVFSLETIADTLVVIHFVYWQTFAVVLTGPVYAGCPKKNIGNNP